MKKDLIQILDDVIIESVRIYGEDKLDINFNSGNLFGSVYRDYCFYGKDRVSNLRSKEINPILEQRIKIYKRKSKIDKIVNS